MFFPFFDSTVAASETKLVASPRVSPAAWCEFGKLQQGLQPTRAKESLERVAMKIYL